MRLKSKEVNAIVSVIRERDAASEIILFGSRADDTKKGGDIDLLVISKTLKYDDSLKIRAKLWAELGEQQIHLLIRKNAKAPFAALAYKTGVRL